MTWSYSRLNLYTQCPYAWFMKYICNYEPDDNFYSFYGKEMHLAIENYCKKKKSISELRSEFIKRLTSFYNDNIVKYDLYYKYLINGVNYINNIENSDLKVLMKDKTVVGCEQKCSFKLDKYNFIGYIDLILKDNKSNNITIVDHKSRELEQRDKTKSYSKHLTLDKYLIQQYLYSNALKDINGEYPSSLSFNCFKKDIGKQIIQNNFSKTDLILSNQWALSIINQLLNEDKWVAKPDIWYCHNLCGLKDYCEYIN